MRTNHNTTRNVADRLYHAAATAGFLLVPALIVGWGFELVEVLL